MIQSASTPAQLPAHYSRTLLTALWVSICALASSCSPSSSSPPIPPLRSDSAGIQIVANQAPDRELRWQFREVRRLGGKEDGAEAFSSIPSDFVTVDAMSRLLILDRARFQIFIFDSLGNFISTAGAKGLGAGEIAFPFRIVAWPDSTFGVFDVARRGYVRFGPDGSPLELLSTAQYRSTEVVPFNDTTAAYLAEEGEAASLEHRYTVQVSTGDSTHQILTLDSRQNVVEFVSCPLRATLTPLFAAVPVWTTSGERIVAARSDSYELRVATTSGVTQLIRREIPLEAVTPEIAEQNTDSMKAAPSRSSTAEECIIPASEVARLRGHASTLPTVQHVNLAPDGTFWVTRARLRGGELRIDVLAADGSYQGTLTNRITRPIAFFSASRFVSVIHDPASGLDYVSIQQISGRE